MIKRAPRLVVAGTGSGCGKTTVTMALLQTLKNRGANVSAFKCGPDYIDPMFHSEIIGTASGNIDLFLAGEDVARRLFLRHAGELNVIEGVMGYYDGISMTSDVASTWHVAQALNAPAILVMQARGMALSAAAVVKGYQQLRADSRIQGVVFNRLSPMLYTGLKAAVEQECGVKCYGYLPDLPDCNLESRHLGLITAQEVADLRQKLQTLAAQAEKSLDIDGLMALMQAQQPLEAQDAALELLANVTIAVARDKVFCFYYRDNIETLQALGAQIAHFSPLNDPHLPVCDGLYLGGGYPELYAAELSANQTMLADVKAAVTGGLPTIGECGGFMYLSQSIGGHSMTGVLSGDCADAGRLVRFGYVTLKSGAESLLFAPGDQIQAHEFHHWDSDNPGTDLCATKTSGKSWRCAYVTGSMYAGFPHLYFPGHESMARRFIAACAERKKHT